MLTGRRPCWAVVPPLFVLPFSLGFPVPRPWGFWTFLSAVGGVNELRIRPLLYSGPGRSVTPAARFDCVAGLQRSSFSNFQNSNKNRKTVKTYEYLSQTTSPTPLAAQCTRSAQLDGTGVNAFLTAQSDNYIFSSRLHQPTGLI